MELKSPHPNDESRAQASLYALGLLGAEEADAFRAHLGSGCAACQTDFEDFEQVTGELAMLSQSTPPLALREKLTGRIERAISLKGPESTQVWKKWDAAGSTPPVFTLPASDGDWEPTSIEGISVKCLFVDSVREYVTMLVKMEGGTSYPPHRHGAAEECYVLEGDLHVGARVLHSGDYQRAESGSIHGVQWTEKGCTLLILSSQRDELLR